jgi:hypothetical protein
MTACSWAFRRRVAGFATDVAAFFTFRGSQIAVAWVLGDLDGLRRQLV